MAPPSTEEPSTRARVEVLATLAIVGSLSALVVGRPLIRRIAPHPTQEQCTAMLERYAEHEARAAEPYREAPRRAPTGEDAGIASPAAADFPAARDVNRCMHDLTLEEVDCALRSNTADELERCLP